MKKIVTMMMAVVLTTTMANALTLSLGQGMQAEAIENGTTITLTAADLVEDMIDGELFELAGIVSCSSGSLTVQIQRESTVMADQICILQCVNSNNELEQTVTCALSAPQEWTLHVSPVAGLVHHVTYTFIDGSEQISFSVVFDASAWTQALENIEMQQPCKGVYTIFGQQLRDDNSLAGLQPGMYIVAGKKVIVK